MMWRTLVTLLISFALPLRQTLTTAAADGIAVIRK
jgi:hypothetical protein